MITIILNYYMVIIVMAPINHFVHTNLFINWTVKLPRTPMYPYQMMPQVATHLENKPTVFTLEVYRRIQVTSYQTSMSS